MIKFAIYSLLASTISISALAVPAPKATKQDKINGEIAALKGTWKIVYFQNNGRESTADELAAMRMLTFDGFTTSYSKGSESKITEIDPTVSPKTIDYQNDTNAGAYRIQKAIYKLEGDSFIECIALGDKDRPKEFEAKQGTGFILIKFMRVKEKMD